MPAEPSVAVVVGLFGLLSLVALATRAARLRFPFDSHLSYLWVFFLVFGVAEVFSFTAAVWILAAVCFLALREYFSLVDIRLQDRWGLVGAYLAIPFMIWFIQIDWYGMFVISIPVYAFLVVPLLVTLGGRQAEGTVFSVGAIDFGLFLFVYCVGHIGYLARFSTWKAILLIAAVMVSEVTGRVLLSRDGPVVRRVAGFYLVSAPLTVLLAWGLSPWTEIPLGHSVAIGSLVPVLVAAGRRTITYMEEDLGIESESLRPGKGQILDHLTCFLYAAPIVFHYIRYFLT
jgi:phosphatidate cytidylyltransferase